MVVDLFIPCFMDQLYPQTGFNVVKILKKLNIDVNYNPSQTCCGQPAFNSGYWDEARTVAQKFMEDFPNERNIICPSASCAGFIKKQYPELFHDTILMQTFHRIERNLFELTDFIVNKLKITSFGYSFPARVTMHDSCAALREYGIKDEPRLLLQNVRGLHLLEMEESDTCCGFGGTFAVKFEPISSAMVQQKMEFAIASGADYIVTTEASCLINMDAYIRKNNLSIKAIHIADILAAGL